MNFISALYILSSAFFLLSCGKAAVKEDTKPKEPVVIDSLPTEENKRLIMSNDTVLKIDQVAVWVLSPEGKINADILILPGWNFEKEKICNESDFCTKALADGYRLILPEMMRSVYAEKYYPETKSDYRKNLTLTWVTDSMIPKLQDQYGIFKGANNYIHGISTGARGAALVHLHTGALFNKVVLLSGDYNNEWLHDDNLMKNTMGPFTDFQDRWNNENNPVSQCSKWTADVYIGHGTKDKVVETRHSKDFGERLKQVKNIRVVENYPDAGHDFKFWGAETAAILKFFSED